MDFAKRIRSIKDLCHRFFKSKLITGSLLLGIGAVVGGAITYLYHLLMGRMLGPVDYGILASLISLSYLLSIPVATLNLVIVRFVSFLKGKRQTKSIGLLLRLTNQKVFFYGLLFLLLFLILTPFINSFLHLNSPVPFIILLIFFFVSIFSSINRSFLQGLMRFGYISFAMIIEALLKLGLAFLLVFFGLKVRGALLGILIATIAAYFITLLPLRFLFRSKFSKLNLKSKEILSFTLPVFLSTLAFTSLFTTDVILARHFLTEQQAGFYAALSTLGKIIFFVTNPIISVVFPMVSERYANKTGYRNLFLASFGLITLACVLITSVYFFLPSLMIRLLYGIAFLPATAYLGIFGVFLSLYSLSHLLVNFYLSIKRTKVVSLVMVAAVLQIVFISIFHQNLAQIIWISVLITALLTFSLLLYYLVNYVKDKKAVAFRHRSCL